MRTMMSEVWVPQPRERIFPFFADAQNLEVITPPWLDFKVLTPMPMEMKTGAKIDYRLRIHGVPVRWQSEIKVWEPPVRFVDSQCRGPYRTWVHEHVFEERDGGTCVKDIVRYSVWGGALVDWLFVRRDVKTIFDYRSEKLRSMFGASGQNDRGNS
ncbi:MAG: hypothetical protein JWR26_2307 [Pedosphaera sp.]|nr:hypothetical protein [Pedosphaera sp.]